MARPGSRCPVPVAIPQSGLPPTTGERVWSCASGEDSPLANLMLSVMGAFQSELGTYDAKGSLQKTRMCVYWLEVGTPKWKSCSRCSSRRILGRGAPSFVGGLA